MLSLIFAKVRAYGTMIVGAVIGLLFLAVKYLSWRRDEAEERAARAEAFIKRNVETDIADEEISSEYSERRAREGADNLTDSNEW